MTRDQKFELAGDLFGVAVAYGGVALGWALGWLHFGILLLVLTVPAGVVLGWLFSKLLAASAKLLDE